MKKIAKLIIGCHKDKKLIEQPERSKYDIYVQAGAARTDERIFEFNDHDGFHESISDRNHRYSEMTAVYWAYHNIDAEYIGIEHYRRRFILPDDALEDLTRRGASLITLKRMDLGQPFYSFMTMEDFRSVFDATFLILEDFHPEDYDLAMDLINESYIRPCNMNIWERGLFHRYCEWLFPMLDEFYKKIPEKRDVNLCRDVGYMAERLTYVFIEKLIREGAPFAECDYRQYKSTPAVSRPFSDPRDRDAFMSDMEWHFDKGMIAKCRDTLSKVFAQCDEAEREYYGRYMRVFQIYMDELHICELSMFEYLPRELCRTLSAAAGAVVTLGTKVIRLLSDPGDKSERDFSEYIAKTGFSGAAIARYVYGISAEREVAEYVAAVLNEAEMGKRANELLRTIDYYKGI